MKQNQAVKYIKKGISPKLLERAVKRRSLTLLAKEKGVSINTLTTLKNHWGIEYIPITSV